MAATPLKGYDYTYFNTTSPSPGVAHVEINRPSKLNAFSEPVWLELGRLFDQLSVDADIRVVLLTASGERAFTAGLDVQAASAGDSAVFGESGKGDVDVARKAKGLRHHIEEFQGCVSAVERCAKRELFISL
jgi:delta(3,5)-delta(2,4)-dienoyl-CoA isomerase